MNRDTHEIERLKEFGINSRSLEPRGRLLAHWVAIAIVVLAILAVSAWVFSVLSGCSIQDTTGRVVIQACDATFSAEWAEGARVIRLKGTLSDVPFSFALSPGEDLVQAIPQDVYLVSIMDAGGQLIKVAEQLLDLRDCPEITLAIEVSGTIVVREKPVP